MLELSTGVSSRETDYFELISQIKGSQLKAMKNYPYILQFLNRSREENVSEALVETREKRDILPDQYKEIMARADADKFKKNADLNKVTRVLEFTMDGLMSEQFRTGSFQPELYFQEVRQYLSMMKGFCYK